MRIRNADSAIKVIYKLFDQFPVKFALFHSVYVVYLFLVISVVDPVPDPPGCEIICLIRSRSEINVRSGSRYKITVKISICLSVS
jgi:hypothetical protein